jgi:hypothetical protein
VSGSLGSASSAWRRTLSLLADSVSQVALQPLPLFLSLTPCGVVDLVQASQEQFAPLGSEGRSG